jgi:hypothetical protein
MFHVKHLSHVIARQLNLWEVGASRARRRDRVGRRHLLVKLLTLWDSAYWVSALLTMKAVSFIVL